MARLCPTPTSRRIPKWSLQYLVEFLGTPAAVSKPPEGFSFLTLCTAPLYRHRKDDILPLLLSAHSHGLSLTERIDAFVQPRRLTEELRTLLAQRKRSLCSTLAVLLATALTKWEAAVADR